jgi:hypothetical protein
VVIENFLRPMQQDPASHVGRLDQFGGQAVVAVDQAGGESVV